MLPILVVVVPILFVLLTAAALLSFAPVDEDPARPERSLGQETLDSASQIEGGKIILFRPATAPARSTSSANEIVACIEEELRQRQEAAMGIVSEINEARKAAS